VASRTIISIPTHSTYSASQRLRSVSAVIFELLVVGIAITETADPRETHRANRHARPGGRT
jgi:hypothetical protein